MSWADRILTIVVTATVTSAAWIVAAGSGLLPTASLAERAITSGAGKAVADGATASPPADELIVPVPIIGGDNSLPSVSLCLNAGAMGRLDAESETLIPTIRGVFDVAHTLKGEGFDASEDGTGRGTPLIPIAFAHQAGGIQTTLGYDPEAGTSPTLAKCQTPAIDTGMAVRCLTPVECERLQGFPDSYTDIRHGGKATPDGPRYKALGNSFAVPMARWVGMRIQMVEDACSLAKAAA